MRTAGKVFLLIMALFFLFPGSAFAYPVQWDEVAGDYSTLGQNAYGTTGSNYVMANPTIVRQHVSSMYVDDPNGPYRYFAEVGWFANDTQSDKKPRFFGAWMIEGRYNEYLWEYVPTPGTNHGYGVGYRPDGTGWHFFIDGVEKASGLLGFAKGLTQASSERRDTGDTNYSHFWRMQKKNSSGTWYNYSTRWEYVFTDLYYYINWPGTSNNEMYMQLP